MARMNPEVIARGLVFHGEHVLVCRSIAGGYAYLPGGHVEVGERAEEALRREFMEETSLTVRVRECVWVHEHLFVQGGKPRHEYNIVFRVELDTPGASSPPRVLSRETDIDFAWIAMTSPAFDSVRPRSVGAIIEGLRLRPAAGPSWTSDTLTS